jgi:hypothetical protein
VIAAPLIKEPKQPVEAVLEAASVSLAPRALEMILPEPWPNIKPKAWIIAINPKTMPTAPLALVPSLPTKAVSTRL